MLCSNAFADDLAPLSIFGGQEQSEIAGSSSFVGDDELKKSGYTDTERIMGRVPGVFSQTEDGLGLRTNIGMRGTNPNRTTKINITEDGILQGPAVYSNPSMYFYPDAGDAEGKEVLKALQQLVMDQELHLVLSITYLEAFLLQVAKDISSNLW